MTHRSHLSLRERRICIEAVLDSGAHAYWVQVTQVSNAKLDVLRPLVRAATDHLDLQMLPRQGIVSLVGQQALPKAGLLCTAQKQRWTHLLGLEVSRHAMHDAPKFGRCTFSNSRTTDLQDEQRCHLNAYKRGAQTSGFCCSRALFNNGIRVRRSH